MPRLRVVLRWSSKTSSRGNEGLTPGSPKLKMKAPFPTFSRVALFRGFWFINPPKISIGPYQRTPKQIAGAIRYSGVGVRSVGPVGDFLEWMNLSLTWWGISSEYQQPSPKCGPGPPVSCWSLEGWMMTAIYGSGQMIIFHQPRFPWNSQGVSFPKRYLLGWPTTRVRSRFYLTRWMLIWLGILETNEWYLWRK